MKTNIERIRLGVFKIWFITLFVVLGAFGIKFSGLQGIRLPFASAFQSLQMMTGLIIPQIGIMAAFYFNLDKKKNKIESLTEGQVTVITWMSITYHVVFILAILVGIVFYWFDRTADGESLQRNTAAVVAIMGLLSLLLTPVAFLFASPSSDQNQTPLSDVGNNPTV